MTFRKRISFWGIIIGAIVDVVGSNLWGMLMTIYVVYTYQLYQIPPAEVTNRVLQIFKTDPIIFTANLIVGSIFSILGGYIGALIAKHDELLNGALSSFLCLILGINSIITGSYTGSLFLALLSLMLNPLICMFGGYLRQLQRSRKKPAMPRVPKTTGNIL